MPSDQRDLILVTGATGYIGRALVARLLAESMPVRLLVRPARCNDIASLWPGQAPQICIGDLTEPASLRGTCAGVDTIVHLASHSPRKYVPGVDPDAGHWPVTAEGTCALLDEAQRTGVRCFVLVSSVRVMGEGSADGLDESSVPAPASAYGYAKHAAEQAVLGIRGSSVVRLPPVYGIGGEGLVSRMIAAIDRGWFPPPPKITNKRSMIHVDDAVTAILLPARQPEAAGIFIATDGEMYSTHGIYRQVCTALGRPASQWSMPEGGLRIAAAAGDWLAKISGRPMPFDGRALEKLTGCAWYRGERMVHELGFVPQQNLHGALPGMVAFHRGLLRSA